MLRTSRIVGIFSLSAVASLALGSACSQTAIDEVTQGIGTGGAVSGAGGSGSGSAPGSGGMGGMPPSCSDKKKNNGESDTDCGGSCPPCTDGKACADSQDCESKVCDGGICQAPSCTDQVQNGTEIGVDCGDPCPKACNGTPCTSADTCTSGHCVDGACCESICDELCMTCNNPGFSGQCTAIPRYTDEQYTCEGGKTCNGAGKCLFKSGKQCSTSDQCASDLCQQNVCKGSPGDPCTSGYECTTNKCIDDKCAL